MTGGEAPPAGTGDEAQAPETAPIIELSRPIRAHGQEVTRLVLDGDPDIGDLKGVRIKIGDGGIDFDVGDVQRLIGPMAGIPPSSAAKISVRDLAALVPVIVDFFGGSQET